MPSAWTSILSVDIYKNSSILHLVTLYYLSNLLPFPLCGLVFGFDILTIIIMTVTMQPLVSISVSLINVYCFRYKNEKGEKLEPVEEVTIEARIYLLTYSSSEHAWIWNIEMSKPSIYNRLMKGMWDWSWMHFLIDELRLQTWVL